MKVPLSVRAVYEDVKPRFDQLKERVDTRIALAKDARWHYESRVKGEESFAQKLETGRVRDPAAMEDFFACTLVVENRSRIDEAEALIKSMFELKIRRPPEGGKTFLLPWSFEFDDLRLYVVWRDDGAQRPTGLDGLVFEIQVKTFLQHAWGIATHDFIYKADEVNWSRARIAFQVKAMLENAELSISQAKELGTSAMLSREDRTHESLRATISALRDRWERERLPRDLRRLAQTVEEVASLLQLAMEDVWDVVDKATADGAGAKTLDLSPYGAILAALVAAKGPTLFEPLAKAKRTKSIFVPFEVAVPSLRKDVADRLIRTGSPARTVEMKLDVLVVDPPPEGASGSTDAGGGAGDDRAKDDA